MKRDPIEFLERVQMHIRHSDNIADWNAYILVRDLQWVIERENRMRENAKAYRNSLANAQE